MTDLVAPRVHESRPPLLALLAGWLRSELFARFEVEAGSSRVRQALGRLASLLVAVGLLSVSWDRFLNVEALSYNVKLPSLAFSLAAVLLVVAVPHPLRTLLQPGVQRTVTLLSVAVVVYLGLRGVLSASPSAAIAQLLAVVSGAVLPFLAVVLLVRTKQRLLWAISWFLVGAVIASLFGLYQLTAFYAGWPQGIEYIGVSIDTGLGRISSFSYEPAYFSYFIFLAFGAVVVRRKILGGEVRWGTLIVFAAMLYLINVRAIPPMAIAGGVLLLIAFSSYRRMLTRAAIVFVCAAVVSFAVPAVIPVVAEAISAASVATAAQPSNATDAPTDQPATTGETSPATTDVGPDPSGLGGRLQALDPSEQSSNSPRLELYSAVLSEIGRSPVFGLGPGNLGPVLHRDAPGAVQNQGQQIVANDIWLQALADGGVPLLLLEAGLLVCVAVFGMRRRASFSYPLVAAWLAVLLIGGLLTSYFFDIKIWVTLGLIVVGLGLMGRQPTTAAAADPRAAA